MNFTYQSYIDLLDLLEQHDYQITSFFQPDAAGKICILRHDIGMSISKALEMAQIEAQRRKPIKSTYYVLLRTDFYNPASIGNIKMLREIYRLGHDIGLHFDEKTLDGDGDRELVKRVKEEANLLQDLLEIPIRSVSMHRPSPATLAADYHFEGLVNTYGKLFFKEFKYLSDSRKNWREDPVELISNGKHPKIQIVIHPVWYHQNHLDLRTTLLDFVRKAPIDRYNALTENIRSIEDILKREEV